ncbi:hypothetical protein PIB30_005878 [Stylosanthes scabra]|uniref:DUF7138 domain-containing protein n=1 Tax=Stylosanthes scabra TaxID=79078 RepID=A0ABU6Q573_9FABA|nr:hypothetical protein [Stylosanthes scabra]
MLAGGLRNFAVVFNDGVREVNVGTVSIDPAEISFKRLLNLLSKKVDTPPECLTVYLSSPGGDRKIHLYEKIVLSIVLHRDRSPAHYFHVIKRFDAVSKSSGSVVKNKKADRGGKKKRPVDPIQEARDELAAMRVRALSMAAPLYMKEELMKMERRSFLKNMAKEIPKEESNGNGGAVVRFDDNRGGGGRRILMICEVCERAEMTGGRISDGGFHHCVNDEIILGFRSPPWGPISRQPVRNSGKDLSVDGILLFLERLEEIVKTETKERGSDHNPVLCGT